MIHCTDLWKHFKADLDPAPRGIWAVYRPDLLTEQAHIAWFGLYQEQSVAVVNPSIPKEVIKNINKKFPNADIVFSRLIRDGQILMTQRKYLKPPVIEV